ITAEIKNTIDELKTYDLFIALDCGDMTRLGFSSVLYEQAKATFCVDHHISNRSFADENYIIPEASSTAELVYRLLEKEKIDTNVAECLFMGIVHDTGVFQYSSTSPETMEIAADLMRKSIRANEIIDKTYYEKTYAQNQILGRALLESTLTLDGKCIVSAISKETMNFHGVIPKDLEGIVSQLRVTQGVEVAIFLYEIGQDEYKISLRASGDVDVSKVAEYFGGGGHKKAAGFTMNGQTKDIVERILGQIEIQL
ncbi:MAG: DHH family phosphoesterase, partial [Tyzzerella sp.]|nr:DHH family phosphoesterase [Tyzzerella sp.]